MCYAVSKTVVIFKQMCLTVPSIIDLPMVNISNVFNFQIFKLKKKHHFIHNGHMQGSPKSFHNYRCCTAVKRYRHAVNWTWSSVHLGLMVEGRGGLILVVVGLSNYGLPFAISICWLLGIRWLVSFSTDLCVADYIS